MTKTSIDPDLIPAGRTLIGDDPFQFHCHPGVSCYMTCCHKLELYLYPYDIIRLRAGLGMHSSEFMRMHTRVVQGSHSYFPAIMLNMKDNASQNCPFLGEQGCRVYADRPSACRTYPVERAVEKRAGDQKLTPHYFMTHHSYCKGHDEVRSFTINQWERDQGLYEYNLMNDYWAEVDAFFALSPWQGEGFAGPRQQLAFMVCYNIDEFRAYTARHRLLKMFRLDRDRRRRIERDDAELLKFGFDWLQYILGDRPTLIPR